ncbi:thiamine phosphate synthase [Phreatobacter cathodiphilus]|uniref:Thiamine phosphate synthase n=1 Tax=Phreatobacter cathodiphilus TaxID=1868589 RepID=A0A2S0NEK0_9HYPH|nr:thiamine phosphate synthase [Phreatobacter cathodiphilus]AVO46371.1 thiamine phosphate synthase [Phreatobacter cathodiphilus]
MTRAYPDRFYPVVDSIRTLMDLAALGVGTIQLRVKDLGEAQAAALVGEAVESVQGSPVRLVINDYWRAAIVGGASHLHLGQEDLATADVPAIRAAGLTLGISTHDEAELETALAHRPDYIALGPIYPTTIKPMRFGPQGLDRIGVWKKRIGAIPLVAIGGITLERAPSVYAAGADSIAVVSDIANADDPDTRVREWLALEPAGD